LYVWQYQSTVSIRVPFLQAVPQLDFRRWQLQCG
jgi:hypothetical protein